MAGHNAAEGFYSVLLAGDRPRCFGAKNVRGGKKRPVCSFSRWWRDAWWFRSTAPTMLKMGMLRVELSKECLRPQFGASYEV